MRRFVKLSFFIILAILIALLPLSATLLMGRGVLPGLLFSVGCFSIFLFVFFFRALWLRRKEKKFIDGILIRENREESPEQQLSGELVKRWKEAVNHLKASRLRLQGNPLYVLPWYMIMGESGSGKTTSIRNSGLSSTFTSLSAAGVSGTKNCEWWFFEEAIIIDTAGRYAMHPDETKDKAEWRIFLNQLARYRKKEPLNGLVVAVSADRLISAKATDLLEEGRTLRLRIEELMLLLAARFPVYILVTKCDLICGMTEFADLLPPAAHEQAMGCMNQDTTFDVDVFLDSVFSTLMDRLRKIRLYMAPPEGHGKMGLNVLLFPDEFGQLKQGLLPFVNGLFSKNVYRELPILRGIYFSSARQSGVPLSHFVKKLGLRDARKGAAPSDKSYFLREFFNTVLPSDRRLFVPTQRSIAYRLRTKAMGFSAWILAFVVFCSLLSYSFGKTLSSVRQGLHGFSDVGDPSKLSGVFGRDLNLLRQYRLAVSDVERRNRERWLPELGLDHASELEKEKKALFCRTFSTDFLGPYDKGLEREASGFTDETSSRRVGKTVAHCARRINLSEKVLSGMAHDELATLPQPDFDYLVTRKDHGLGKNQRSVMEDLYRHYLLWSGPDAVEQEKKTMRGQLIRLAGKKDLSLRWMIDWCNENSGRKDLTLSSFWGGSRRLPEEARINPAFTAEGSKMIMGVLEELEVSLDDPIAIKRKRDDFTGWYKDAYRKAWLRFARNFPWGSYKLTGSDEQLTVAKKIAGGEGPYMAFLDRMANELPVCLADDETPPDWMSQVFHFSAVRNHVEKKGAGTDQALVDKVKKKGVSLLGRAGQVVASRIPSAEALAASGEIYTRYKQSLESLAMACASRPSAFKLASEVFKEDPAMGESFLASSKRYADDLKSSLPHTADSSDVTARLIDSPVDFLLNIAVRKAACHIQDLWSETVLSEIQGVKDKKTKADMLMGKDGGLAIAFVKGPAAPFVGRDAGRGYYARHMAGKTMPFNGGFFSYLTKGAFSSQAEQALYKVRIEGVPTDTNPDATVIPHVTRLEMECAGGVQNLEYYNYPASRVFEWAPAECEDVSLRVSIGDLSLKREYNGFRAFARFLKDFSSGQHTFYRADFPGEAAALKRMGIKFFKVKYRISGGGPVISLLTVDTGRVPEVIVSCSD